MATTVDLIWLPAVTAGLRERLEALDVSWVADTGEVHIRAPWGLISEHADRPKPSPTGSAGQSFSPGALATLQHLLEHPAPTTQQGIAAAVGLSQPRIAQVLKELAEHTLVARGAGGWRVVDARRGFDSWLTARHMEPALTTTWYGLASPSEQLTAIAEQGEHDGAGLRMCGDWAADTIAAWRLPGLVVVHSDITLDLDRAGFVRSERNAATAIVHIGQIRPQWKPAPEVVAAMPSATPPLPLAPVTEIAREMLAAGGSDAEGAVDELRGVWLRARAVVEKENWQ